MIVYFNNNGEISAITPAEDKTFSELNSAEVEYSDVEDFITGKKCPNSFIVKRKKENRISFVSKNKTHSTDVGIFFHSLKLNSKHIQCELHGNEILLYNITRPVQEVTVALYFTSQEHAEILNEVIEVTLDKTTKTKKIKVDNFNYNVFIEVKDVY